MTISTKLFVSHLLVAGVVILLFAQLFAVDVPPTAKYLITASVLVGLSILAARLVGQQTATLAGLELIERAIVDGKKPVGNSAFHHFAERLQLHVQRFSSAAAEGRTQTRELDALLSLFESDPAERRRHGNLAGKQIRFWLSSLGRDTNSTLRELIARNQELDVIGKQVTTCAQDQNETATVATREIESLSDDVAALASVTTKARNSAESTVTHTGETADHIEQLSGSLQQICAEINDCLHEVRSMRDQTVEIQALVQAINDNSAKADMLALNASIESVRAGELGRGFAVVAEEIRKLAKQINTSALTALEQISLIDAAVEQSSSMMASERDHLSDQEGRMATARESIEKAQTSTGSFHDDLDIVDKLSKAQSRRVEEVARALQEILSASDSVRGHVIEGGWKTRSLTELISRLTDVLEPLMLSSSQDQSATSVDQHDIASDSPEEFLDDEILASYEHAATFDVVEQLSAR